MDHPYTEVWAMNTYDALWERRAQDGNQFPFSGDDLARIKADKNV